MFDKKINELFLESKLAGMSVAVTNSKEIIYKKSFGFDSAIRPDVPSHPDALYKIASMTKTFTSIMILRLCEEGILDLDTPIKNYVSEFELLRHDVTEAVTLRHLMCHISGLPPETPLAEGSRDESTMNDVILNTVKGFEILSHPSDRQYRYTSWGYNIIGMVASKVTQRPYTELVYEYVLKPLGMNTSTFDYFVASTYPLSLPHIFKDGNFSVIHRQRINTAYHAGAGLYSNTEDMCKLSRMFLNDGIADSGEVILNKKSFDDMLSKHIEKPDMPGEYYGLGIFVRPFGDGYIYGHTGNYEPYNSSFFVDKGKGIGVVTMLNSSGEAAKSRVDIYKAVFSMI